MGVIQACTALDPIFLTPLVAEDETAIALLGSHPDVFADIPQISSPFDAKAWCTQVLANPENYVRHLVRLGPGKLPAGYVQICRRSNLDLDLGYWLGRPYWGKGIGSRSATAALILFLDAGGQPPIFAATTPGNIASRTILAKLGFKETIASEQPKGMIDHLWDPRHGA